VYPTVDSGLTITCRLNAHSLRHAAIFDPLARVAAFEVELIIFLVGMLNEQKRTLHQLHVNVCSSVNRSEDRIIVCPMHCIAAVDRIIKPLTLACPDSDRRSECEKLHNWP